MKKTLLLLFAAIFTMGAMAKVGKITATADVASGDVWVFGFNNPNGIDFNYCCPIKLSLAHIRA